MRRLSFALAAFWQAWRSYNKAVKQPHSFVINEDYELAISGNDETFR